MTSPSKEIFSKNISSFDPGPTIICSGDKFLFLTVFKNSSKLPFLSTDLTPALLTVNFKLILFFLP